jgi:hypothetical protein
MDQSPAEVGTLLHAARQLPKFVGEFTEALRRSIIAAPDRHIPSCWRADDACVDARSRIADIRERRPPGHERGVLESHASADGPRHPLAATKIVPAVGNNKPVTSFISDDFRSRSDRQRRRIHPDRCSASADKRGHALGATTVCQIDIAKLDKAFSPLSRHRADSEE